MAIESETAINEVCAKCGKSLRELKLRKNRRFCSALCRTRFFALQRYHEIKSTEPYKAKRKIYEKNWRINNKEKWNERMKKASKKYRDKLKNLDAREISHTPLDEGLPGQQTEETICAPELVGADAGRQVEEADQSSQNSLWESVRPDEICVCGHSSNNHSYDPEGFESNLGCDICDCKDFKKKPTTAFVEGPKQDYGVMN